MIELFKQSHDFAQNMTPSLKSSSHDSATLNHEMKASPCSLKQAFIHSFSDFLRLLNLGTGPVPGNLSAAKSNTIAFQISVPLP